jgi:hypothetical protein
VNSILKRALNGAASGFIAALLVDVHSWSKYPEGSAFDWNLAVKRWIGGAVAGAAMSMGIVGTQGLIND